MKTPIETLLESERSGVGYRRLARATRALRARKMAIKAYVDDPQAPRTRAELRQLRLDAEAFALSEHYDWFYVAGTANNFRYADVANNLRQLPEAFARGDA